MKRRIRNIRLKTGNFWVSTFWQHPNRLMGLKVSMSVGALLIPAVLAGYPVLGGTLALGALGGAIAETDDHPKGRVKSLALTIIGFLVSSTSVVLLYPYPAAFAVGLFLSSFIFIIAGGISERYRGVTFGTLLVGIYAMLGYTPENPWFLQPLALAGGALFYALISLLLLIRKPWRPLQERLSVAYRHLAEYIELKSKLFPSDESTQDLVRNQLAQKNIALVQSIKGVHRVLRSYAGEIGKKDENLSRYYAQWLILQQLHERAASSHESYDLLSSETDNIKLIEGLGQMLREISKAVKRYSEALIIDKVYKHPISLQWTVSAYEDMLEAHRDDTQFTAIALLFKNLSGMEHILSKLEQPMKSGEVPSDYEPLSITERLRTILKKDHPRFKYAVRLSISLLIAYGLMHFLQLERGEWIPLTTLFVMQQSFISTRQRFVERVMGTLYGVVAGLLLIQLLPTMAGHIILLLLSYYLFFYFTKQKYSTAVIFVTIIVMTLFNIQFNQGLEVMGARVLYTIIGSALAYLSVRFILPDWQYRNLSQLLARTIGSNKAYFEAIYSGNVDNESYAALRREAHRADTALTSAWQSIKVEPRVAREFREQAFRLTYLNHSMLSYISAFGAHHKNKEIVEEDLQVCQEISLIMDDARNLLLDKENGADKSDVIDTSYAAEPAHAFLLLGNIRHFAGELHREAKTMG